MEGKNNGNTVLLTVIGVATLLVALVGATFAYFSATVSGDAQDISVQTATMGSLTWDQDKEIALKGQPIMDGETVTGYKGIMPGASDNSTFTVEYQAGATYDYLYDLGIKIDTNDFTTAVQGTENDTQANQLVITIDGGEDFDYSNYKVTDAKDFITYGSYTVDEATATVGQTSENNHTMTLDVTDSSVAKEDATYPLLKDVRIASGETHSYAVNIKFMNFAEVNQNANQTKNFAAHLNVTGAKLDSSASGGSDLGQLVK